MTIQLVVLEALTILGVKILFKIVMASIRLIILSIELIKQVVIVHNKLISIFKVIRHIKLIALHIKVIIPKWYIILKVVKRIKVERQSSTIILVISIRRSKESRRIRLRVVLRQVLPKHILIVHIKVIEQIVIVHKVIIHIASMVHIILKVVVHIIIRLMVRIKLIKRIVVTQRTKLPVVVGGLIAFRRLSIQFFLRLFLREHILYIYLKIPMERIPLDTRRHSSRLLFFHEGRTQFCKNYKISKIPLDSLIFHNCFFIRDIFYSALSFYGLSQWLFNLNSSYWSLELSLLLKLRLLL